MATADLSAIDRIAEALSSVGSVDSIPADWECAISADEYARQRHISNRAANYTLVNGWREGRLERRAFKLSPVSRPAYLYRPAKKKRK